MVSPRPRTMHCRVKTITGREQPNLLIGDYLCAWFRPRPRVGQCSLRRKLCMCSEDGLILNMVVIGCPIWFLHDFHMFCILFFMCFSMIFIWFYMVFNSFYMVFTWFLDGCNIISYDCHHYYHHPYSYHSYHYHYYCHHTGTNVGVIMLRTLLL